ncbi:hypothetical protein EDC61_1222 [Sulfuritortus calidifontis]|uniref:Restriction endonuclease n=1 Tax=Sulfuritortus calidifontis TaxID=1914471 RepID=A0A4R3JQG3_9PROT|nr:hypothetical protein [Sulfuritortus calidifontis]TCS68987.1 hypothetical protein EDC61_1222 [Sulfuritortus calidifontis]
MHISSVRGLILEELVLHLLTLVGYRVVAAGEEGTRSGHSGLEVQGRGEWHQIDALAAFDRTPAFMYPLRLMVEAKCHSPGYPVGIQVVRNVVGVLKDISENYFTYQPLAPGESPVVAPRFNYHSAVFSASGYTSGAQKYAIAHQIFLIQYKRISLLVPVIEGIRGIRQTHVESTTVGQRDDDDDISKRLRSTVREMIRARGDVYWNPDCGFSRDGIEHLRANVIMPLLDINGSYFGMLQGKWPMHLLSSSSLPPITFAEQDEIRCRVYGRDSDRWSFSPVDSREGDARWFRLEFDIPEEILGLVQAARSDPHSLAQVKQQQFSFLDLAGRIGGVYRQVRLRLDEEWLEAYLQRIRARR